MDNVNLFIKSALSQFEPQDESIQAISVTTRDGIKRYTLVTLEEILTKALNCIIEQEQKIQELEEIKRIIQKARED